ncbi:MAG: hypothetical protein WDO15_07515 [Bacteroidota bacterium]
MIKYFWNKKKYYVRYTTFIGNEVISWMMTNAPINGIIIVIAWLAWTIRGATSRFDKEIVLLNGRIDKEILSLTSRIEKELVLLNGRIEKLEDRVLSLEQRFEKLEEKVDKLSDKFDRLLEELRNNRK